MLLIVFNLFAHEICSTVEGQYIIYVPFLVQCLGLCDFLYRNVFFFFFKGLL